jgi:hypothetical protein
MASRPACSALQCTQNNHHTAQQLPGAIEWRAEATRPVGCGDGEWRSLRTTYNECGVVEGVEGGGEWRNVRTAHNAQGIH